MKSEEVTDDQVSVMSALVKAGVAPYADLGAWRPFGPRTAKNLKFTSQLLDNSGSWRCKEIPGPDSFSTWEACWRVFRVAATMCDVAAPAVRRPLCSPVSVNVSTGFSVAWYLTHDVGRKSGKLGYAVRRNFTILIQNCLRLSLIVHGTV